MTANEDSTHLNPTFEEVGSIFQLKLRICVFCFCKLLYDFVSKIGGNTAAPSIVPPEELLDHYYNELSRLDVRACKASRAEDGGADGISGPIWAQGNGLSAAWKAWIDSDIWRGYSMDMWNIYQYISNIHVYIILWNIYHHPIYTYIYTHNQYILYILYIYVE